jgi:hypothetical protein
MDHGTTLVNRGQRLAEVRRHMEVVGVDVDAEHEIYHPDAVLEFPQSRERFEGVENFRAWRAQYPSGVELRTTRVAGDGEVWVGFAEISYDGGPWRPAVAVLEYRGELVARETIYVTEHFEAPAWREKWRSPVKVR